MVLSSQLQFTKFFYDVAFEFKEGEEGLGFGDRNFIFEGFSQDQIFFQRFF